MFTGIIAGRGTVRGIEQRPAAQDTATRDTAARADNTMVLLHLDAGELAADITLGASIAVDGVCLTVVDLDHDAPVPGRIALDVMGETLARSTLGELSSGDRVNLERCTPVGARLDGHIVQGHVDGVGRVLSSQELDGWQRLRFSIPARLARYVAEKGSIAIDGVSLTVTQVSAVDDPQPWFEVALIPATLEATGLGAKAPGQSVNLETDVLAKYAERLLGFSQAENAEERA